MEGKLSCDVVTKKVSADPTGGLGAGMDPQNCPKLMQGDQPLYTCIQQSPDPWTALRKGMWPGGRQLFSVQSNSQKWTQLRALSRGEECGLHPEGWAVWG